MRFCQINKIKINKKIWKRRKKNANDEIKYRLLAFVLTVELNKNKINKIKNKVEELNLNRIGTTTELELN